MDNFSIKIHPQYVKLTEEKEVIDGKERYLHEVQKRIKLDFEQLPEFTIITAPTGTGKSYAFPFPVLNANKQSKGIDSEYNNVRGLIVLPTNALISELTASFRETYRERGITVNQLTGPELTKYGVKGLDRWKKAIEIVGQSDLLITNPDLINYAMHGGYHQWAFHSHTGSSRFTSFLDKFHYIIFDEYHLFDEAQIANILTLVKLRQYFLPHEGVSRGSIHGVRFLFVSATPEEGLKQVLESEELEYEEIIESISSTSEKCRVIHGPLEVEYVDSKDLKALIRSKIPELREVLKRQKALLILDKLRDVQELSQELKSIFNEYIIYQSTGYVSKFENHTEKIRSANLIIATNKAEVGVNYDVEYCIMQPGKYFQNFVQRFGRVARGNKEGKIVIFVDKQYSKLKRMFEGIDAIEYYDFLEKMRERLQGRKFYAERIPMFVGEYIWCIQNNIRRYQEFDVSLFLQRRLKEESFYEGKFRQRFNLLNAINEIIRKMIKVSLNLDKLSRTERILKERGIYTHLEKRAPRIWQWVNWWNNYLQTYLTFRDGSKQVKIYDRSKEEELDYSLDWILQHKIIEKITVIQTEPFEIIQYTVGNLKEQNKDIQYTVSTIPSVGAIQNNYLNYRDRFDLDKVFKNSVQRIYDKVRKGDDELDKLQANLCKLLLPLAATFNGKRLKIEAIDTDDTIL